MEINSRKAKKISKDSLYSSNSSSSSSSSSSSEFQLTPKPPLQSRPDSSLRIRQRAYTKRSDHSNEDLIDSLQLNDSRPNSSLSKYKALPQIGTKIDLNQYKNRPSSNLSNFEFNYVHEQATDEEILIGFRLPNGTKRQNKFDINCKIRHVLNYAINEMNTQDNEMFTLLQMPNLLINDLDKTLKYYRIQDRSMLFVIDTNLL